MAEGFEALKGRLDEIVEEVGREDISLDEALRLYEEAVNIGIAACDASELDVPEEGDGADETAPAPAAAEAAEVVEVAEATETEPETEPAPADAPAPAPADETEPAPADEPAQVDTVDAESN